MLRWLSSVTQPPHHHPHQPPSPPFAVRHTTLTDDPLATCITLHRNSQVYAVSRVNPLYSEDEFPVVGGQGGTVVIGGGDRREAVGGGGGGSSGYSSRRSKKSGGSGGSSGGSGEWSLSPIPEGRLPPLSHVQVPRPVWPPRRPRLIDIAHAPGHAFSGGGSDSDGGGSHTHALAHAHTPEHLLRTLSHTISLAVDQKVMPPEQVLRTLGETINRSLEAISLATAAAAASGSTPGGGGSGREPLYHDSSSASSSGFSDLTATPPSSSGGSGAIYDKPHSSLSRAGGYEKLIRPPPPLYEAPPAPSSKHQSLGNPFMCRGPDFTLDAHQAELLMRKLKQSKRQRCWCRAVTSLMALFFFLFSVMLVSMLLTRGKRFFGSL